MQPIVAKTAAALMTLVLAWSASLCRCDMNTATSRPHCTAGCNERQQRVPEPPPGGGCSECAKYVTNHQFPRLGLVPAAFERAGYLVAVSPSLGEYGTTREAEGATVPHQIDPLRQSCVLLI